MVATERIKRAEAEEEVREANLEKEALRSALRLVERQSLESHSRSQSQANSEDFKFVRHPDVEEEEPTRSRSSSNVALKSPRASGAFGDEGDSNSMVPASPVVRAFSASAPFESVPASPAPVSPAPLYVPPPREDDEGHGTHGRSQLAQSDVVDEAEVEAELTETSRDRDHQRSHSPVTTPRPSTPTDSHSSHSHPDVSPSLPHSATSYSTSQPTPTPTSTVATSASTDSPLPLPHPQLHRDRTYDRARSPSPALLNMSTNLEGLSSSQERERKRTSLQKQPVAPPPSAVSEGMEAPWANGEDEERGEEEEEDGQEMTFTIAREGLDVESPWADR